MSKEEFGELYLVPVTIAPNTQQQAIPPQVKERVKALRYFLAEDIRSARRYLSSLQIFDAIEALRFEVLNKDTPDADLPKLMAPLLQGESVGLLSESGCPGVADPGSKAVLYAHRHDIHVVPLVGPCSLLLALMASGLNGQQFAFHGYLPVEPQELGAKLKELERESKQKSQTQIFIETPYRNNYLFEQLKKNLNPKTLLSVALGLTGEAEFIKTQNVEAWQKNPASWPKEPAVFMFLA
ncbi:MAG: SAM-dependent methyltransferase [Bacteroidota bacterium]